MKRKLYFFVIIIAIVTFPSLLFADLTGIWSCDDGGKYYIKQSKNTVVWYGELEEVNPIWSNVFIGTVSKDKIQGNWFDVPKGKSSNAGILYLVISEKGPSLRATKKTGGFGGSIWKKVKRAT